MSQAWKLALEHENDNTGPSASNGHLSADSIGSILTGRHITAQANILSYAHGAELLPDADSSR